MHDDNCERHDFAVGDFPLKDCSCRLRARLSKAEALLARIDNSDAIIIDRDMPQIDIDIAERIYDDLHAFLAPDSATHRESGSAMGD